MNRPQAQFLGMPQKMRAFVAGFGAGKTWVGCTALCLHFYEHPGVNAGFFSPTYRMIRDIFYPTLSEVADAMGLDIVVRRGNHEVEFYSGDLYRGTVICRSMDDPGNIAGFKIGYALIDEIDLMKKEKATLAWRKIMARMRHQSPGLKNRIDVTTTPEGYNFVYDQFKKSLEDNPDLSESYGLIQASTYENEANLPADYIKTLSETYPSNLIQAYLNGQFVNLVSGSVFPEWSREMNSTTETIQAGEDLHIGMDFNVGQMTAIIFVVRDNKPLALDSLEKIRDTPAMIDTIKRRFYGHKITIYPDATGKARKTVNASQSDLSLLRAAGLDVRANHANPRVKDRVMAVCRQIHINGKRDLKVNISKCGALVEAFDQQVYDKGEPDKSSGLDHAADAAGYFLAYKYPIVHMGSRHVAIGGI